LVRGFNIVRDSVEEFVDEQSSQSPHSYQP
jgi:hypothetical protein